MAQFLRKHLTDFLPFSRPVVGRDIISPLRSASPRTSTNNLTIPPSSAVHGDQHDTKICDYPREILQAAFVADTILGRFA